jgi:hypothetical protein
MRWFHIAAAGLIATSLMTAANPDYFPLAPGNRWEYRSDRGTGRSVVEVLKSESIGGQTWYDVRWLDTAEHWLRVDEQDRVVALKLDRKRSVVWVDFAGVGSAPYETSIEFCVHQARATPEAELVRVRYLPGTCADAGLLYEVYAAGIGLKERSTETFAGAVTWKLVSARIGGRDLSF